jgi:hypothetical protein
MTMGTRTGTVTRRVCTSRVLAEQRVAVVGVAQTQAVRGGGDGAGAEGHGAC